MVALNILTAKLGAWDLTNGLQSIISLVCVCVVVSFACGYQYGDVLNSRDLGNEGRVG